MDYDEADANIRKSRLHRWFRLRGQCISLQSTKVYKRVAIGTGKRWRDDGYRDLMRRVFNETYQTAECYRIRNDYSCTQSPVFTLGPLASFYFLYKLSELYAERYDRIAVEPERSKMVARYCPGSSAIVSEYLVFPPDMRSNMICQYECISRSGKPCVCERICIGRDRYCSLHSEKCEK